MNSGVTHARARLDAWRMQGDDRLDPVRFHRMDALAKRAEHHEGEVRRMLDERLAALIDAYAGRVELAASGVAAVPDEHQDEPHGQPHGQHQPGPLAALLDTMASRTSASSTYPELALLDHFRERWSQLSTGAQLRRSLDQVPGNAGPLNSSSLVHRSLSLMHALSPGYLQQFLSYVDALSWMEQMSASGALPARDATRAGNARKSVRGKAR